MLGFPQFLQVNVKLFGDQLLHTKYQTLNKHA